MIFDEFLIQDDFFHPPDWYLMNCNEQRNAGCNFLVRVDDDGWRCMKGRVMIDSSVVSLLDNHAWSAIQRSRYFHHDLARFSNKQSLIARCIYRDVSCVLFVARSRHVNNTHWSMANRVETKPSRYSLPSSRQNVYEYSQPWVTLVTHICLCWPLYVAICQEILFT